MQFRFAAHDPRTGEFLRMMPRPVSAQIGDTFGTRGTLELTYAGGTPIETFLEVRASVSFGGDWEPVGPALLRLGGSHEGTDATGMRTVTFVSREWLLDKARVGEDDLELIDEKRPFYQASPGAIMRTLLLEAQDRGAASGIVLGDFNASRDSAGNAWPKVATIYYGPGLPIGSVLENLVEQGMCDYRMNGRTLELYAPEKTLGRDLTTGGDPVRVHGSVSEAPVTYTLEDLTTSALLIGEEGFQLEVSNPSAPTDYGRLEVTIEQGGVNNAGTARTMIDAELQRGSREIREITRTQHSAGAKRLPFRDYRVGDYVQAYDEGAWQRYRVREIQLVMDGDGWTIHTVLNDRLQELLLKLAKRTNGIANGSKGSGGDGTPPAPAPRPGIEPAAPEGLVIDQQVYLDGNGDARGVVTAGWADVTESVRGRAIDIGGYELWRRDNDTYAPWRMVSRTDGDTEATDSPVWLTRGDGSAAAYQWRVRAIAQASGRTGPWSRAVTLTMTQDTTPPPPPSAPVVTTGFRIVTVEWDGLTEDGTFMPSDFSRVNVYVAGTENMEGATLAGSLSYPGSWNSETMPADVAVWVTMTAVDRVGNESEATPAVSVTPRALVDEESIQAEVDRIDDVIQAAVEDLQDEIEKIVIDDAGAVTYWLPTAPDSSTDPAPKTGDLWFDTSADGGNRLSRFDGTDWVSVADERIQDIADAQDRFGQDITDAEARALEEAKALAEQARQDAEAGAATDAQAKADTARDAAISDAQQARTDLAASIDQTIEDARTDLEADIATVRTSVDGKNAITQSVDAPPTQYDGAVGDRWERMSSMGSGGSLISNWRWNGTVWVSTIISDAVLGNVDAGKLVAGSADIKSAVIDKLWVDGLNAKAATFQQVTVSAGNIVPDPNGLDPDIRDQLGGTTWSWNDTGKYWTRAATQGGTTQFNAFLNSMTNYDSGLLSPGAMYVISFDAWVDKVSATTAARSCIYYRTIDGATRFVGDDAEEGGDSTRWDPIPAGQWVPVTRHWRAPDDVSSGGIGFQILYGAEDATEVRIRKPFVGKQASGTLIEDGAVTTDKVAANAITAGKILAGSIEAEHIVAGGIEASSLIVSGSVGSTLIKDGAVTTGKVAADAIGAKAIAAGVIDARHIIAGGIQASSLLVNGSVGSTLIENGAVTTDKIKAGAITADSGIIASLNAGVITAGTLDAARIGADTITGEKLLIGGVTNLLPGADGWATSNAGWSKFGHNAGAEAITIAGRQTIRSDEPFHLAEGKYVMSVDARGTVPDTMFYTQMVGPGNVYALSGITVPGNNVWGTFENTFTISEPGEYIVSIYGNHANGASNDDGWQWFRNMRLRPMVGGTLIEDGAITTGHILANAITAGKIATRAITAGKIAANAVRADEIAAGAIDGKIITGATVRTSASGARVQLNANGLYAYNASGKQTVGINAQTGAVNLTADVTQTNSYGSVRFGPQPYSGSDVSPALEFQVPGHSWYGNGGVFALDDGSAGFPTMRVQGFVTGPLDGSAIQLAPGGTSTDSSTFLRRVYPNGAYSRMQFNADHDGYLEAGGGSMTVRSRNTADTSTNADLVLENDGSAWLTGKSDVRIYTQSASGAVRLQKRNTSGNTIGATMIVDKDGAWLETGGSSSTFIRALNGNEIQMSAGTLNIWGVPSGSGVTLQQSGTRIYRASSSRANKLRIEDADYGIPDLEDKLLDVRTRSWYEIGNSDAYADYLDKLNGWAPLAEGETCTACEEGDWCAGHKEPTPAAVPRRNLGAVAEEIADLGLDNLVVYDPDGKPDGLMYDRFGVLLIPIVKRLRDRVDELELLIGEHHG